jgi:hypothetical protein
VNEQLRWVPAECCVLYDHRNSRTVQSCPEVSRESPGKTATTRKKHELRDKAGVVEWFKLREVAAKIRREGRDLVE